MRGKSIEEGELEIYKRKFGEGIEIQNEKYRSHGNYSRVKSVEEIYNSKRYRPTEEILQVGNVSSEKIPTKEQFTEMAKEYFNGLRKWSKQNGNHLTVLSLACHFDEASPHAHLREIWSYIDENGVERIGQEKGMEQAGVELPELSEEEKEKREKSKKKNDTDRTCNRGITSTAMCRKMWQDICEAHGFEIERTPLEAGRKKHETVAEYHARMGRELAAKEKKLKASEKELEEKKKELEARELAVEKRETENQELILLGSKTKAEQIAANITSTIHPGRRLSDVNYDG